MSNLGVQPFEYTHFHVFCAVHNTGAYLQALIQVRQLLIVLQKMLRLSLSMEADVGFSEEDCVVCWLLEEIISQINLSLKYINSCKAGEGADIDSEVVEQK